MVHGSRFEEQLYLRGRQLCRTREDLGDDSPCDIYRLRYPNLHPNLQTRKYHLNDRHDMDPDLDPDIVVVQHPPSLSHAGLLLMDALGQPLWHKMQPKGYITCRDTRSGGPTSARAHWHSLWSLPRMRYIKNSRNLTSQSMIDTQSAATHSSSSTKTSSTSS